jgi:hypothetical protein
MSTPVRQPDHAALGPVARQSAGGRSRRADDGALTEMARSLLRDARRSRGAEPGHAGGSARLERTASGSSRAPTLQETEDSVQMNTDLLGASELAAEAA